MRAAPVLALLLLVAGCGETPDFDRRYDETANAIVARARAIDANVAQAENAAASSAPAPASAPAE